MRIAVVDYGMGNLRSVSKAIERVAPQAQVRVTADPEEILSADRVVVPGQGAMPDCMRQLAASGARDAVVEAARARPFLGICIGLQMLFEHGEEGDTPGLGVLGGEVPRFRLTGAQDSAHGLERSGADPGRTRCGPGIPDASRFYFVHSYYPAPRDAALTAATTVVRAALYLRGGPG